MCYLIGNRSSNILHVTYLHIPYKSKCFHNGFRRDKPRIKDFRIYPVLRYVKQTFSPFFSISSSFTSLFSMRNSVFSEAAFIPSQISDKE